VPEAVRRSQPIGVARELRRLIFTLTAGPETLDVASLTLALQEHGVVAHWAKAAGRPAVEGQVLLLKRRFADSERLRKFGFSDAILRATVTPAPAGMCRWCLARA
jgi:hypothetical protein